MFGADDDVWVFYGILLTRPPKEAHWIRISLSEGRVPGNIGCLWPGA